MIKKLNLKLILLECLALFFIISGVNRFYVTYNGELFDALANKGLKKIENMNEMEIEQFIISQIYWNFASLGIGMLIAAIINWRYKFGIINSIIVVIITLGMALTGIYSSGIIHRYLNSFCRIFSKEYRMSFLIGGMIILFIGTTILWKTIIMTKNTVHNKMYY